MPPKSTSARGRQAGNYTPPILAEPKGGPIPKNRPLAASPRTRRRPGPLESRRFNANQPRDPDGQWSDGLFSASGSDGMPTNILSSRVARGRATVSRLPGGGNPRLTAGDRHVELDRAEVEQFRDMAIDARYGDGPGDGVFRMTRRTPADGGVRTEVLVSLRPVPGRYVDEDGRPISSPEDTDGEAYFAEYDMVIDEDDRPFDENPSIRVGLADLDPQENRNGIYGALLRAAAAERVDGGAGPIDVYVPRNGRVGFRMKGDDGKPVEVEFGSKDIRRIHAAAEQVQDEPGTTTVETAAGPVEVTFTEHGSLMISPPSGGPWGIAASGGGVAALMDAFTSNATAAGIFN